VIFSCVNNALSVCRTTYLGCQLSQSHSCLLYLWFFSNFSYIFLFCLVMDACYCLYPKGLCMYQQLLMVSFALISLYLKAHWRYLPGRISNC
jgi:hypothetical protein